MTPAELPMGLQLDLLKAHHKLVPQNGPPKCNFSPKCFSCAKDFNITLAITSTETVAVPKLNNETLILNDLVIIKEPETHLEFIKPRRFISLHKKDYCKLQRAVNHILFPEVRPNFKRISYLASDTFQDLQAFSKSKYVCKLA